MASIEFVLDNVIDNGSTPLVINLIGAEGFVVAEPVQVFIGDGFGGSTANLRVYDGYYLNKSDVRKELSASPFIDGGFILTLKDVGVTIGKYDEPKITASGIEGGGVAELQLLQVIKPTDDEIKQLINVKYFDHDKPTVSDTGIVYPLLSIGDYLFKAYTYQMPVPVDLISSDTIYIGFEDTTVTSDFIGSKYIDYDLGTINIPDLETISNMFSDIQITLSLPYIESPVSIDNKYSGSIIKMSLKVYLYNAKANLYIYIDDVLHSVLNVDIGNDLPLVFKQTDSNVSVDKYVDCFITQAFINIYYTERKIKTINSYSGLFIHNENINLKGNMSSVDKNNIKSLINQGIII